MADLQHVVNGDLAMPALTDLVVGSTAMVKSVTIKGVVGAPYSVYDLNIAAPSVGTVSLMGVQPDNGSTPFGVTANTLSKLSYCQTGKPAAWIPGQDTPGDFTVLLA